MGRGKRRGKRTEEKNGRGRKIGSNYVTRLAAIRLWNK